MNGTQTSRSIAAGSGPGVQALINEWTDTGFMVESTFSNGRWWHRRGNPGEKLLPPESMTLTSIISSADPAAPALINEWTAAGSAVVSLPIGGLWYHRRAEPKAATR